ncbi:acyl carrier protein [Novimethylophilus kurashikiensis]|uniref:Acyl carrier protein n=1 Tax=Novimethylophilus kurashikiensis TaxID=1825523 RepID=A0A2R5FAF2_9PROT|nr:acyl carrier protein [Novimethylophilus kurashikiensis]GBG15177.1 acyl carrier protein [Novimethylophilus kurashikiensis]
MDTFETLRDIIVDKFEKDPATITPDATFETLEIDSLDTFDIIFAAEEKFGIKVPNEQVDIKTVQDVVNLLDKLRAEQGKA